MGLNTLQEVANIGRDLRKLLVRQTNEDAATSEEQIRAEGCARFRPVMNKVSNEKDIAILDPREKMFASMEDFYAEQVEKSKGLKVIGTVKSGRRNHYKKDLHVVVC